MDGESGRGVLVCFSLIPLLSSTATTHRSSADIQLQRLMTRDNSSREDASARLNSQLPIAQKVEYADIVLDNSGTVQDLEQQVRLCLVKLERIAGWSWRLSWLFPPFALVSMLWTLGWRSVKRSRRQSRGPFKGI